jgi:predicted RNase H-like nuclease
MKIIGIDLAWKSENNTTGLAVGELSTTGLHISGVNNSLAGLDAILAEIALHADVGGIAIDAPLVIENHSGQRLCERQIGQTYGARKASCHTSNRSLYPDAASVRLANSLLAQGFEHLGNPTDQRWQIECYPHPAIIEMFGLPERLMYKKGKVGEKKRGQVELAKLVRSLEASSVLPLTINSALDIYLDEGTILSNVGVAMKRNEDALDAIVCVYIGALYASQQASSVFGDVDSGYIYVPTVNCC